MYEKKPEVIKMLFTDNDFEKIALVLRLKSLPEDIKQGVQDALYDYVKWSCATFYRRSAADRKKLNRIYKLAKNLREELSDVLFSIRIVGNNYVQLLEHLSALEGRSKSESKLCIKKQGRKTENLPLRLLVDRLVEIYKAATNKKPTLTKATSASKKVNEGTPGGAFFRFVTEFISVAEIQYHSNFSLSAIIEDVIYIPKNQRKKVI